MIQAPAAQVDTVLAEARALCEQAREWHRRMLALSSKKAEAQFRLGEALTRVREAGLTHQLYGLSFEAWVETWVVADDPHNHFSNKRWLRGAIERYRAITEFPRLAAMLEEGWKNGRPKISESHAYLAVLAAQRRDLVRKKADELYETLGLQGPSKQQVAEVEQRARELVEDEVIRLARLPKWTLKKKALLPRLGVGVSDETWVQWREEAVPVALRLESPETDIGVMSTTDEFDVIVSALGTVRDALNAAASGDPRSLQALVDSWKGDAAVARHVRPPSGPRGQVAKCVTPS